jgi:ketopantoate reductase
VRVMILGAGAIATALAKPWIAAGHEVTFGVRDPRRSMKLASSATLFIADALGERQMSPCWRSLLQLFRRWLSDSALSFLVGS